MQKRSQHKSCAMDELNCNVIVPLVNKLTRKCMILEYPNRAIELIKSCIIYLDALVVFGL
jgi:hypothetical protein